MKRVILKIEECQQCPYYIHDDGDGESPWDFENCIFPKDKKDIHYYQELENSRHIITPLNTVPDWCPLKNA